LPLVENLESLVCNARVAEYCVGSHRFIPFAGRVLHYASAPRVGELSDGAHLTSVCRVHLA